MKKYSHTSCQSSHLIRHANKCKNVNRIFFKLKKSLYSSEKEKKKREYLMVGVCSNLKEISAEEIIQNRLKMWFSVFAD